MASIVLSAVGTALGGPIGGAIGALAGRQIDSAIFSSGSRDGPRIKDLSITTSSYGTPVARHFGQVRTAGTLIWATDLVEHGETSGGKGKPKTTHYSYSMSFAVALSSRPVARIGRIWADGNLLRGAAGDLKSPGILRFYSGFDDQWPDPLLAAALGSQCPAFRGMAYAVFENLSLADFGNRLPALTFELFADEPADPASQDLTLGQLLEPVTEKTEGQSVILEGVSGYSHENGPLRPLLAGLQATFPFSCHIRQNTLHFLPHDASDVEIIDLPPPAAGWEEGSFGAIEGSERQRRTDERRIPRAIRYYDPQRDYQPGVQYAAGASGISPARMIEFPATMQAEAARKLIDRAARTLPSACETLHWRMAELDPAIVPGTIVRAPGHAGLWQVARWDWREKGIELKLKRITAPGKANLAADPGMAAQASDIHNAGTVLHVFELPWDGAGSPDDIRLYAASGGNGTNWHGAALYAIRDNVLLPTGTYVQHPARTGRSLTALPPSHAMRFEAEAQITLRLHNPALQFSPTDMAGIAMGHNRLLVGEEIIQFATPENLGEGVWRLSGLLRGRGGTEHHAMAGHIADAPVVMLDEALTQIDPALAKPFETTQIGAIGRGDDAPVSSSIHNHGASIRPLPPVHPRILFTPAGDCLFRWTRRARGQWHWADNVDSALVEQAERYQIGLGPVDAPLQIREVSEPELQIDAASYAAIAQTYAGHLFWVRQVGSHAVSLPVLLHQI
ncbi:MAG: phage tail protein [Sphingomonadaceae bacterium]